MIEIGTPAPDFTLETDLGEPVTLAKLLGKKVVLCFYPKDNTPGCTIQACDFRDAMPRFDGVDAVVLGVSPDSVESHAKFRKNFDLTFPLLADTEHEVAEAYGVWGKRKTFGVSYEGVERSTFLIDENGIVVNVWREVKAAGHMEMLAELLGA